MLRKRINKILIVSFIIIMVQTIILLYIYIQSNTYKNVLNNRLNEDYQECLYFNMHTKKTLESWIENGKVPIKDLKEIHNESTRINYKLNHLVADYRRLKGDETLLGYKQNAERLLSTLYQEYQLLEQKYEETREDNGYLLLNEKLEERISKKYKIFLDIEKIIEAVYGEKYYQNQDALENVIITIKGNDMFDDVFNKIDKYLEQYVDTLYYSPIE